MKFAKDCDGQDRLLEYHPEKSRKARAKKLPRQNMRKSITQIAREFEQKRHGDGFVPSQKKQEREDRKELSKVLSRLYYKWGRDTLEGWIREIFESL